MLSLKTFLSIRKSTSVRASKYFYLLILTIVSLFLQAYMHNYNIVYAIMFFLVSVALVSTFFGVLNLYHLEVSYLSNKPFFSNKTSDISLLIYNNTNYTIYDLNFTLAKKEVYVSNLQALESKPITFQVVFEKRGKHTIDNVEVLSFFPLNHEKKMRKFKLDINIIVYPNPKGVSLLNHLSQKNHFQGDLSDFKGITRFIDGEKLSLIHWASLAKNEELMSKRFLYSQAREKLHFSIEELQGTTEEKLSQLTKWILEAHEYNFDFTLDLNKKVYDSTKEDVDAILTQLAIY